ncbi:LuxR family transcriptional regulator [Streptomyces kaniharaensis]|uniref:LuxR family transcriptional regulator n=1 Tax=Streptomyces kaniharaensis TaxID=212423 RepID=A0A6N7KQY9_9ACTN|nr:LuxR family transcriptional regulator [Streptomyces kaniharaensis]MQS12979.1 LuxR family transcriptional regulator [Streptomyces kaniharaensis]
MGAGPGYTGICVTTTTHRPTAGHGGTTLRLDMHDGHAEPETDLAEFDSLSEDDIRLFHLAVGRGQLDPRDAVEALGMDQELVGAAVRRLERMHLLRPLPAGTDGIARFVPVNPDVAAAGLVAPLESELRRRLADTQRVRGELALLGQVYAQSRARDHAGLDEVRELGTVIDLIADATARCREEALTCQPGGGRAPHLLEQAYTRDLTMIRRGVRMRTLYQHTARHHAPTQEYVERITQVGAEVRTTSELFGRMIAFDREVVFIPHQDDPDSAVVIRDPSTVGYLCTVFDQWWSQADHYTPARFSRSPAAGEIKEAIIRLLAEGLKDEVIARRLGMSLRTCRKHIAEIMEILGAESRFQAGYLARAAIGLEDPGVA